MRVNSMNKYNEKKKDISKYVMWAIVLAFICAFFLNILAKLLVIVFKVIIKYWWGAIILILILIILRKIGRKKKQK